MDQGIITIIVTIVTTLGGAKAWEFYQKKLEFNRADEIEEKENALLFRDDLRERVAVLEERLENSRKDKDGLMDSIAELKMSLAEFKTRIEFLEKSIIDKDDVINSLKTENAFLKDQISS